VWGELVRAVVGVQVCRDVWTVLSVRHTHALLSRALR
jgi:hypothetical protein